MKTTIRQIISAGVVLLILLSACSRDEDWTDVPQNGGFLQIEGEIVGAGVAGTRANTLDPLTLSYHSFAEDDEIGFFSFHEESCDRGTSENSHRNDDDTDYLRNEKLIYTKATGSRKFTSQTVANVTLSKLGMTFAYFPYSSYGVDNALQRGPEGYVKKNNKEEYESLGANDYYLNIFREDGSFEDFLTASKRQYFNVNYEFNHHFSMLLLYLGEGFSPATEGNDGLKVHLTEKVLGAHVTRGYTGGYESFVVTVDKVPMSEADNYSFGCSESTAKKVENYKLPGTEVAKTVYPIILPPGVEIDYIEVTDISGMKQKVKPTKEALPELVGGWMYPMTIKMSGITPVIYPHEIIDWNNLPEIEVEEQAGIYDAGQFKQWLSLYNQHIENITNLSGDDFKKLESYGVWNQEEKSWTFYLRDNIDCTGIVAEGGRGALIKELPAGVILDGGNYVLSNLMLNFKDSSPTDKMVGMIGEINGGTLQNLHVEFVTVRNMSNDIPSGCIAAKISSGTIRGCAVRQAALICGGVRPAGVLAGSITGGTVHNCKFHGFVQADVMDHEDYPLYKGVVGTITPGGINLLGDIVNRLVFTEQENQSEKE